MQRPDATRATTLETLRAARRLVWRREALEIAGVIAKVEAGEPLTDTDRAWVAESLEIVASHGQEIR